MTVLKVSKMTGKLTGIPAINTNPLSNPFCMKMEKTDAVCRSCYSTYMLRGIRKNCIPAWESNGQFLSKYILEEYALPMINAAFIRLQAHGELINETHFINLIAIANKNQHATLSLWTKRKDIVKKVLKAGYEIPKNMIMVYSNPSTKRIINKAPENFNIVFNVVENDRDDVNCGKKKCIDCMSCYDRNLPQPIVIERLKKIDNYLTNKK